MLSEGDAAPDFTLPDQDGNELTLSDLRGQTVVLYLAAEARAGQKPSDALQLVREGREELARRAERWKEEDGDDES